MYYLCNEKTTFMKKRHIFLIVTILLLTGQACRKINPISDDPSKKLEFSADTVIFDTVFTTLGSATHQLRVYNRNNNDLNISSIRLIGGEASPFRINFDGDNDIEWLCQKMALFKMDESISSPSTPATSTHLSL